MSFSVIQNYGPWAYGLQTTDPLRPYLTVQAGEGASSSITMTINALMFGASSAAGGQFAVGGGNTEDSLTNVVRAINELPAGSLAYSTVGSPTARPVDYILSLTSTGKFIRNRGVGGLTPGPLGTVVSTMSAAVGVIGPDDFVFLQQGDNGVTIANVGANEDIILAGFAAMRALAPGRPFIQIVNTQGGYNYTALIPAAGPTGSGWGYAKDIQVRVLNDQNPGTAFSFHQTIMDRATDLTAGDLIDRANGVSLRSHMMTDGSHQWSDATAPLPARGYHLQSNVVLTPVIDAVAGGTPFPIKQIIEAVTPATPAAGDVIGNIVFYGSGGTALLDSSNIQADYAISASGQITRIGATPPTRDLTFAAVKTSKAGRFDKVQPLIGICERAASGVSKMVEFDGASLVGMSDSKLTNTTKLTVLMRLQQTATGTQIVAGATSGFSIRILTAGTVDIVWRNAAGVAVYSDTSLANFRAIDPPRWIAVCIDLTGPAVGINKMVTWVDPVAPSATRLRDAAAADVCRLTVPFAIGAASGNLSTGGTIGQFRIGDFTLFNDYIDFTDVARRQEVSETDGTPKSAWVSGGGVTNGITPLMYMGGNAGDWRRGRLRGSTIPASPGASGQYIGFNCRERSPGVPGFLVTA